MANQIRFYRCKQAQYDSLASSNTLQENALYYILDKGVVLMPLKEGEKALETFRFGTEAIVNSGDTFPVTGIPSTFYYNTTTGKIVYYTSATSYIVINDDAAVLSAAKAYTDTATGAISIKKSHSEWLTDANTVYAAGTLLVYTDRTTVNGVPVPDIKIADGVSTVSQLDFLTNDMATSMGITKNDETGEFTFAGTANKVAHTLTIGDKAFDGSADVTIPVYAGE